MPVPDGRSKTAKDRLHKPGALCVALWFIAGFLAACFSTPMTGRVALLAPFEGRYREVGYNALYAARLALTDAQAMQVELMPIDDGGTGDSAAARARALAGDPQVKAVIVLGHHAADAETQRALGDVPLLLVGAWHERAVPTAFALYNPAVFAQIDARQTHLTDAAALALPVTGAEMLALEGFAALRRARGLPLDGVTVLSSGTLPDASFIERYTGGDPFAPQPGVLATLTYDAARIAIAAVHLAPDRGVVHARLVATDYTGWNGAIRFEDGVWVDAPLHTYRYRDDGTLVGD